MNYPKILSIYNSLNYTYSTLVKNHPDGLELDWISTIDSPFDYEEDNNNFDEKSIKQFKSQFEEIKDKVDGISLVFPAEMIMVSQFPIDSETDDENIKELLQIEIRKAYPALDIKDFEIKTYTLNTKSSQQPKMMCVMLPRIDKLRYENLFNNYGIRIVSTSVSQISAANCFLYNYPEHRNATSVIVGIQGNFLDFTIIENSNILYYNLLSYQQESEIPQILTNETTKVNGTIVNQINGSLYCYGEDLSNDLFNEISQSLRLIDISSNRLNAFRMLRTYFDKQEIEYCKKVAHIFPPVIGASFPSFFNFQLL